MKLAWDASGKAERSEGKYLRKRSDKPYHTNRWTRLSKTFRAMNPLCAECLRNGVVKSADVVDHIEPWPICEDFYDTRNLQSLCEYHNIEKGNRDKKRIEEWRKTHPDKTHNP